MTTRDEKIVAMRAEGYTLREIAEVAGVSFQRVHRIAGKGKRPASEGLTPREEEIVKLISEGNNRENVAAHLGMKLKAVEFHKTNIHRKLGVGNDAEITRWYAGEKYFELLRETAKLEVALYFARQANQKYIEHIIPLTSNPHGYVHGVSFRQMQKMKS
jgi:DNA-binding CsgD family transcriptional regulator